MNDIGTANPDPALAAVRRWVAERLAWERYLAAVATAATPASTAGAEGSGESRAA